ncbi:MAG: methylated-DNA--[protein]-cysteine S-methyltransferase [Chloroflexi bacterium]|nr:methylated-DNA--[protein]-cysteine S-methyltransferase [Chloroflexota bacterium]
MPERLTSQRRYYMFQCAVGWVVFLGSEKGLTRLSLKPTPEEAMEEAMKDAGQVLDEATMDASWFQPMQRCVESYLEGDQRALDEIVLDLDGTPPFFRAAWAACRGIPSGETRSYAWLAAEAGSPLAVRAAGQAMARNRWPLIIPCHRVIGSDGGLGGYGAGGLRVKAKLLQLEQSFVTAGDLRG